MAAESGGGGALPSSAPAKAQNLEAAPKKAAVPKKDAAPKKEAAAPTAPSAKDKASKREAGNKKDAGGKKDADAQKKDPSEMTDEEKAAAEKLRLKKVLKEGGKRGVEIEGAADMGGLQFFCTSVDEPQGDLGFLEKSMEAMNAKCDPTEEERKGGSGHIGKMLFSAGADHLGVCAYVPEAKQEDISCEEWIKAVLAMHKGEVIKGSKTLCTGIVKTDSSKCIFPLKIREPMILEANNFLRKKGLFPEDDGSDDEMVFGDDDFPS